MTIYHLCVKTFSRSAGQSAVAAAAYRSGLKLKDERTGETADYTPRKGVLRENALLVTPAGSPSWTRQQLWNAAEASENRKNSTVAREIEISLPSELDQTGRIELAHAFGQWVSDRYKIAADVQIHDPVHGDDARNFHSHILLSTRELGSEGFGKKTRVLDDQKSGRVEIEIIRKEWADRVNAALMFRGFDARVDHRSNARRGLDDTPTIHKGRGSSAASRAEFNAQVEGVNQGLRTLLAERAVAVVAEAQIQAADLAKDFVQQVQTEPKVKPKRLLAGEQELQRVQRALNKANAQRERVQATVESVAQALPNAPAHEQVLEARRELQDARIRKQQAEQDADDRQREFKALKDLGASLPRWNLFGRQKHQTKQENARRAAEMAAEVVQKILDLLFGSGGARKRRLAEQSSGLELKLQLHRRMRRRDQVDSRLEGLHDLENAAQAHLDKLSAVQPSYRPLSVSLRPGRWPGSSLH